MEKRLFVKSRNYLSLNIDSSKSIHKDDIVEVGYKVNSIIILLNITPNRFTIDNFSTLDNKRVGYDFYLSPLFNFKDKRGSSILYFGEDIDTIKNNYVYTLSECPKRHIIMVEEFKNKYYSKYDFRLITIEEERMMKMKSIGLDVVS
jgi:hypothetical protein